MSEAVLEELPVPEEPLVLPAADAPVVADLIGLRIAGIE
jgi:hypothetical protein